MKTFLCLLFLLTQITQAGIAWVDDKPLPQYITNSFHDTYRVYDPQIIAPSEFKYTLEDNFTKLSWSIPIDNNNLLAIWRCRKEINSTYTNWYGYSCIAILPTTITSLVDKDNIVSKSFLPPLNLLISKIAEINKVMLMVQSASTNYYWFLDYTSTFHKDDWWYPDDIPYGRGNKLLTDTTSDTNRFYYVYYPQYVTDNHYFIFAFIPETNILQGKIFIDNSSYPNRGLPLDFFGRIKMSHVVNLIP